MGDATLRYEIEDDLTHAGETQWRAVALDPYGQVQDATRWVGSPPEAMRHMRALQAGRYWASDGDDPWREWQPAAA